jgi:hypothetical protein
MKKLLAVFFTVAVLAFHPPAEADEGFKLAKDVIDILSKGTFRLEFRTHPTLPVAPVRVYNVKGGVSGEYTKQNADYRSVYSGGQLYSIDDKSKVMEIRPVTDSLSDALPAPGDFRFAGRGEEQSGGKKLPYEDATDSKGVTWRFVFDGAKLAAIERKASDGAFRLVYPAVQNFSAGAEAGKLEIPKGYTVRKTLERMKEDAAKGIWPDDPVDKLALQTALSEDERIKNERAATRREEFDEFSIDLPKDWAANGDGDGYYEFRAPDGSGELAVQVVSAEGAESVDFAEFARGELNGSEMSEDKDGFFRFSYAENGKEFRALAGVRGGRAILIEASGKGNDLYRILMSLAFKPDGYHPRIDGLF